MYLTTYTALANSTHWCYNGILELCVLPFNIDKAVC